MLAVAAVNYLCALPLNRHSLSPAVRKLLLWVAILGSLSFLVYFKYAAFFLNTLGSLLGKGRWMEPLSLPIGISFYTFQALTYTVDVYRGKAPVQRDPAKLLLYISCFPQLIAGPIVQYADIAQRLDHRTVTMNGYIRGFHRFAVGLSKKVLLANLCGAALLEVGTAADGGMTVLRAWMSILLYTFQIYFDFSAYSDMAIGIGAMLGFKYKENFDHPYLACSITEFWRRWHMSLGAFFRDYVYIPLGGSRRGPWRTALNLLIVWGLTGLWHGASWNFLLWGLFYGLLLIFEKMVLGDRLERIPRLIRWPVTIFLVMLGFILFYYEDLHLVLAHLLAIFGGSWDGGVLGAIPLADERGLLLLYKYALPLVLMALCSTPLYQTLSARWKKAMPKGQMLAAMDTVIDEAEPEPVLPSAAPSAVPQPETTPSAAPEATPSAEPKPTASPTPSATPGEAAFSLTRLPATPTPAAGRTPLYEYTQIQDTDTRAAVSIKLRGTDGSETEIAQYRKWHIEQGASLFNRLLSLLPEDGHMYVVMAQRGEHVFQYTMGLDKYTAYVSEVEDYLEPLLDERITLFRAMDILEPHIRAGEYVYFMTDHHWTVRGAYYVHKAMVEAQGLRAVPLEDYVLTRQQGYYRGQNYNTVAGLLPKDARDYVEQAEPGIPYTFYRVNDITELTEMPLNDPKEGGYQAILWLNMRPWKLIRTYENTGRKMLLVCDSMGMAFAPFMACYYDEVHIVRPHETYYSTAQAGGTIPWALTTTLPWRRTGTRSAPCPWAGTPCWASARPGWPCPRNRPF